MASFEEAHHALVTRLLGANGEAAPSQRRAAFDNAALPEPLATLVRKVAHHAYKVGDADIAAVRAAGLSEDQVFELVVCAAVGQATRQHETAMVALDAASPKE